MKKQALCGLTKQHSPHFEDNQTRVCNGRLNYLYKEKKNDKRE